jgi:hypothetical protein
MMRITSLGYHSFLFHANCKSILDWDGVAAVPLKLSTISIAQSFFSERVQKLGIKLDAKLDALFRQELNRMEWERSSSTQWSQMFQHSKENTFLFHILRLAHGLPALQEDYPEFLAEALRRSPETLALAESEWKAFSYEFYTDVGLPMPDNPQYVEIQEALGLYGRSQLERTLRRLKRNGIKWWNVFADKLWSKLAEFRRRIKRRKTNGN